MMSKLRSHFTPASNDYLCNNIANNSYLAAILLIELCQGAMIITVSEQTFGELWQEANPTIQHADSLDRFDVIRKYPSKLGQGFLCNHHTSQTISSFPRLLATECRIIKHTMGETCVPINPQCVVTLFSIYFR